MFRRFKTNFKGRELDVPIGPLTAITGKLHSGKSAVLRGAVAALTPNPPANSASKMFKFASKSATTLYAHLYVDPAEPPDLSLGAANFSCTKDNGKPRAPQQWFDGPLARLSDEEQKALVPTVSYRSLFELSDQAAREALYVRFAPVLAGPMPMPQALDPEAQLVWDKVVAQCSATSVNHVELLTQVSAKLRERLAELRAQVRADKHTVKDQRARLEFDMTGAERIPELETEFVSAVTWDSQENARAARDQAQATLTAARADLDNIETELTTLKTQKDAAAAALQAAETELAALQQRKNEIELVDATRIARLEAIVEIHTAVIRAGGHDCAACDSAAVLPAALERSQARLATRRKEQATASQRTWDLNQQIGALRQRIIGLRETEQTLVATLAGVREQREQAVKTAEAALESAKKSVTVQQAPKRTQAEITADLEPLRRAQALRAEISLQEQRIRQATAAQSIVEDLLDRTTSLYNQLLVRVSKAAEEAVNANMEGTFRAKLQLEGDICTWCILDEDGEPRDRHQMSGSEKSSMLIGLALTWTEGMPIRLLFLDDDDIGPFQSSPTELRAFLLKLEELVNTKKIDQLLVAGIRPEEVPPGWLEVAR